LAFADISRARHGSAEEGRDESKYLGFEQGGEKMKAEDMGKIIGKPTKATELRSLYISVYGTHKLTTSPAVLLDWWKTNIGWMWTTVPDLPKGPRVGLGAAVSGGKIYAIGGCTGTTDQIDHYGLGGGGGN